MCRDPCALLLRDHHGAVAARGIDHDALVAERETVEAVADVGHLVLGDDDRTQPRHTRLQPMIRITCRSWAVRPTAPPCSSCCGPVPDRPAPLRRRKPR